MNQRPIIAEIILDKKAVKHITKIYWISVICIFCIGFYKGHNFKNNKRKEKTFSQYLDEYFSKEES